MSTVQEALDRASGKKTKTEVGRNRKLSTCHGVKLVKRKNGKGYCCSQCGFVACDSQWTQLQIDMK